MPTVAEESLQNYGEHARTLRTWLVAYGIGAPILLMTNEAFAVAVRQSGYAKLIAGFFFSGVALQVLFSAINKSAAWGLCYGETAPLFQQTHWWKWAHWFSERYWIDFLVDLVTLLLFGFATWKVFFAVIRASLL